MKKMPITVLAFALIGCAPAPATERSEFPVLECRDVVTNALFMLDPAKIYRKTLNLTGENYAYFDLPDGRTIKVSESWAATACRTAPTKPLGTSGEHS